MKNLARVINADVYIKHQTFSVDEIALYQKEIPSRTFIAREPG